MVSLKVVQTRTLSENSNDELVELCLACEPNVFRAVIYGVEHETAVSVESDLPFVLMGVVLFVGILGGLIYVKVGVNMKEPGPNICACTTKTAGRKTL
jgi:hypothetical protein